MQEGDQMIEKKSFGKTGHESTRVLFGAAALGDVSQADADRTLDLLLEYGINHIDTAATYGDAEKRIGPWMPRHRDKFFLATKSGERTYSGAMKDIENSRKRLKSDVIDLWQMHGLFKEDEWQTAMGNGGALEAFIEAREKGWVRFLGVTGHGIDVPDFHLRSLERFPFDSVLFPWNYPMSQNSSYSDSVSKLKKICRDQQIAMQSIKSICRRPWPEGTQNRATWYEPLESQDSINKAMGFVLSNPDFFLNSAGDIHILPRVLKAADDFFSGNTEAPEEKTMQELLEKEEMVPLFQ